MLLTKTYPEFFNSFLESVGRLQPASVQQVCSDVAEISKPPNIGPVRSAIAFGKTHAFLRTESTKLELDSLGSRLLRVSGNHRVDFLIFNAKLLEQEPFDYLRRELKNSEKLSLQRLGKLLQLKFDGSKTELATYAKVYASWLVYLRVATIDEKGLSYVGGKIEGLDVIVLDEAEELLDRTIYDHLTENFPTYHNLLDEPNRLLNETSSAADDESKGGAFESFIAECFKRLGFSSRIKDGSREQKLNLTFQRKGGGDAAMFCHFPIIANGEVRPGFAIACESKATEGAIGSRAVAQARNLRTKIEEAFPKYVVHTVVLSRRNAAYDSSGRDQAPPDVIHLTDEHLLDLLGRQAKLANKMEKLITPLDIMTSLDDLVTSEKLEPTRDEFTRIIETKLS